MHPLCHRRIVRLTGVLLAVLTLPACADEISGTVREEVTLVPIEGAMVTLQASSVRALTGSDGRYTLSGVSGSGLIVVGAKKGYFNVAIAVAAPAFNADILLKPVPQTDDPNYILVSPETCSICHPNQYTEWTDSPMARAGLNTWVHDLYNGTGTAGGMGGFVYTRDSRYAGTNFNSECASCHQPESWIAQPFSRMENPTDPGYPSTGAVHGVSCDVCHKVADVDVSKINFPGIFPGAVTFTRPQGPSFQQVQYGLLGDTSYSAPMFMRGSYQPQLAAEVCAACHQDANDPAENHTYTGIISEPTYTEWVVTPYADPQSPLYQSCVGCHMPPTGETQICTIAPVTRDPATIRSHRIEGTTPYYLENAADLDMQVQHDAGEITVDVTVTNSQTGHHVPTGVTVRNMILLVEAWREADGEPLVYTGLQTVHELGGVGEPAQGYYAGLPGKLFAKVIRDADGNSPTFFTDAEAIVFDNRIPALEADVSSYSFAVPDLGGEVRVRARLIYRRSFRALTDAKQWTADGHGNPLADIQPPHYGHLMEMAETVLDVPSPDFDGDRDVDLTDFAVFVLCYNGPGAPPAESCPAEANADFDGDGDVDLVDMAVLAAAFTGSI